MPNTVHAFDYLAEPRASQSVQVLFGDEPFLKQLVWAAVRQMAGCDEQAPAAVFDGSSVEWRDVHDELCTVSLFNPNGPRVAMVEDADPFVTTYRVRLEDYLKSASRHGVLVLEVTKWAANTKLYKLVDQHGLQVECRLPQKSAGRQKVIDSKRMEEWLVAWGQSRHNVKVAKNAAQLLLELIGPEFGLLDQELARLALYTDKSGKVTEALVREYGGGWRAKTAWELIEAALDGQGAEALAQLDRLLFSGEHPNALFGPISWSLRRFASATRVYQRALRQRRPMRLSDALERGGFFTWQHDAMRKAEEQIKQLGQQRAGQLHQWLLEADLSLKGSHSSPEMARLALEHLILRLDRQLAPARR